MLADINPSRRSFLASAAAAATALALGGLGGCHSTSADRQLSFTSFAAADEEIARLMAAKELESDSPWNLAQTIAHCAQSIEYSMIGYPQPKSALFQHTAGAVAFEAFSLRGRMSHDLAEPIPGAPPLNAGLAPAAALERLHAAVQDFQQWRGLMRPHFAYGELSKKEYELAHAMHLANHLSAFDARSESPTKEGG